MKRLLLVIIAAVGVIFLLQQLSKVDRSSKSNNLRQPSAPFDSRPYLPLSTGNKWTYRVTTHSKQPETYYLIREISSKTDCSGYPCFVIKSERGDPNPRDMLYGYQEVGVVSYSGNFTAAATKYDKPFLEFPSLLSSGTTWQWEGTRMLGGHQLSESYESRFLGFETCTVPAGTFECIKIRRIWRGRPAKEFHEYWYAKDVGLVKLTGWVNKFGFEGNLDAHELISYEIADSTD